MFMTVNTQAHHMIRLEPVQYAKTDFPRTILILSSQLRLEPKSVLSLELLNQNL